MLNAVEVSKTESFLRINDNELVDFLSCSEINIDREEIAFFMFKKWIKADVLRNASVETVLSTGVIRFGLLSGEFIIDEVEPFLLSTGQSNYIQELLSSCKNYQILSSSRRQN